MQLSKNQRFLTEYQNFSEKISKITNEQIKNDCLNLLNELSRKVKDLDQQHLDIVSISKIPADLDNVRNEILSVRKKLFSKLEDCQKANMIK
jgi:hypothetical protein